MILTVLSLLGDDLQGYLSFEAIFHRGNLSQGQVQHRSLPLFLLTATNE